ncbi:MAG TPA: hypothetical protein VHY37_04070 [Tepidisphaeraceae bacterium]|nr:hypothetical protein [Tepidisphaeraceae bacterium]
MSGDVVILGAVAVISFLISQIPAIVALGRNVANRSPIKALCWIAFVFFILCYIIGYIAALDGSADGDEIGMIAFLVGVGGAAIVWVVGLVWAFAASATGAPLAPAAPIAGFAPVMAADGPGRFLVKGVDRDSRMDTAWHVHAESEANARAKAELEGIIVTRVEREPPA